MFEPVDGGGKSHLAAAIGRGLVERLARPLRPHHRPRPAEVARRELALEAAINRDKHHLLILDDLAYVTKDQAETSVLFELIGARYERRSILITANQPFGEWNRIFPDPAMTLAAVDRLVHHATILELNVESYRRRSALERQRGSKRPPRRTARATSLTQATINLKRHLPADPGRPGPTRRTLGSHPDRRAALTLIVALQMRSWVSTTASAMAARHSTAHTARIASRRASGTSRRPSA